MKKRVLAAVCMAAMAVTACSGGAEGEGAQAGGKQKLVLSTYGLSEDISAEEVYAPFEEQFNCQIVTETGGTNDRYTKLKADSETTIDVIELSQAMAAKGAEEGLFETIDLSKIEHASDLIAAAKTLADNGQGVPYTINSIGIMYNPEAVGFEITGFDDLWKPELQVWYLFPRLLQPSDRLWYIWPVIMQELILKPITERLLLRHWRN